MPANAMSLVWDLIAIDHASRVFERVGASAEGMGVSTESAHRRLAAGLVGVAAIAGGIAVESVKMAADFETAMTKLVTTAGESKANLTMVGDGLLKMAGDVGFTATELAKGMYTVESGGYHGAEGLKVMEAAAKGARIEGADLTDVSKAVVSAMNDYKGAGYSAADVTNVLTAATSAGMVTFQQMSAALPNVGAAGATAGVGLGELTAAIATMTSHGTDAAKSGTYLRQMIGQFEAPTAKARAAMKGLGIDANVLGLNLGKNGLASTIEMVQKGITTHLAPSGLVAIETFKKTLGSTQDYNNMLGKLPPNMRTTFGALADMTGGVKSLQAFLQLGGVSLETFKENTAKVNAAVHKGSDEIAGFAEQQGTLNGKMNDARGAASALGITLGNKLLPMAKEAFDNLNQIFGQFAKGWREGFAEIGRRVVANLTEQWGPQATEAFNRLGAIFDAFSKGWQEGFAELGRRLVANLTETGVMLRGKILEAFDTMRAKVLEVWHDIVRIVVENNDAIRAKVIEVGDGIKKFLSDRWDDMRNKVIEVWNGIKGKIYEVNDAIRDKVIGVSNGIRDSLTSALMWLWHTIFEPVWEGIKIAVAIAITAVVLAVKALVIIWQNELAPGLMWLWHTIFEPAWNGIQTAVRVVVDWFTGTAWPAIQTVWKDIEAGAMWLWHNAIEPVWAGIQSAVRTVVEWFTGTGSPAVQGAQTAVGDSATSLWHEVIEPVWSGIKTAVSAVVDWFTGTVVGIFNTVKTDISAAFTSLGGVVEKAWTDIQTVASPVVDWISKTVVGTFNTVQKDISAAFSLMGENVTKSWNDIRDTAKAPIEFVVNTVFAGLVDTYNSVAEKVGAAKFDVPHVQFAGGGPVGGYSPHDRADNIPAWLTADEFILPVAATRALRADGGDVLLERLRTWDKHADGGLVRGYADGGSVWDSIKSAVTSGFGLGGALSGTTLGQVATAVTGDPIGAIKSFVASLLSGIGSGAFPDLAKGVVGKAADGIAQKVQSLLGAVTGTSASGGGVPTSGQGSAAFEGWWAQAVGVNAALAPYYAAAVTTARNESGFNPSVVNNWDSNALAGTPSAGLMQFIESTFRSNAWPGYNNWMGAVDQILAWKTYADRRYSGPNNIPGVKGVASGSGYVGYGDGGLVKYDSGGWLQPGFTAAWNGTGKPERVRTAEQETSGGGTFHLYDVSGVLIGTMRGEIARADRAAQLTAAAGSSVAIR